MIGERLAWWKRLVYRDEARVPPWGGVMAESGWRGGSAGSSATEGPVEALGFRDEARVPPGGGAIAQISVPETPKPRHPCEVSGQRDGRRLPTLPPGGPGSTIGARKLNFRVRYGNGWILPAIITDRDVKTRERGIT